MPRWKTDTFSNRCAVSIFSPPAHVGSLEQVKFGGAADSFSSEFAAAVNAVNKENLKAQTVEIKFSSQLNMFQLGLVLSL